jgi:hypothetical protein
MISFKEYIDTKHLLKEGGNIFKLNGTPITQRIQKADVIPTIKWLESITGLSLVNNMLGTTGKKASSGDLDLAVDAETNTKDGLIQKLSNWVQQNFPEENIKSWIIKSGISVHFKTPINGDSQNGFVQTDFMFGDPKFMQFALRGFGEESAYKGSDFLILMSSIAKPQGYKWSHSNGLINRETNTVITKDPNIVAQKLLGSKATIKDLDNFESVIRYLKKYRADEYEMLVADAKETLGKEGKLLP